MTRRDIVACAVAAGLGVVLPSRAQDNEGGGPSPGLQLFTIRRSHAALAQMLNRA